MKVVPVDQVEFLVIDDRGHQHRVFAASRGSTRWVFYEGDVWAIETGTTPRLRTRAAGHETLSAPMPATVLEIPVGLGTVVTKGQTVLLLEAMKMEMPLRAAHDGIVTAIRCAAGELVQPGVTLIEIE
jgi:biotin carboxyl carrier protein